MQSDTHWQDANQRRQPKPAARGGPDSSPRMLDFSPRTFRRRESTTPTPLRRWPSKRSRAPPSTGRDCRFGKDFRSEEHAIGFYTSGERMKFWGSSVGSWAPSKGAGP